VSPRRLSRVSPRRLCRLARVCRPVNWRNIRKFFETLIKVIFPIAYIRLRFKVDPTSAESAYLCGIRVVPGVLVPERGPRRWRSPWPCGISTERIPEILVAGIRTPGTRGSLPNRNPPNHHRCALRMSAGCRR